MLIRLPQSSEAPASEITPESVYRQRRRWLQQAGLLGLAAAAGPLVGRSKAAQAQEKFLATANPKYVLGPDEKLNKAEDFKSYCNFYEFGVEKSDPPARAHKMKTRPWSVVVEGEINKPQTFDLEALLRMAPLEERIYRFRCVEGWSMVIPWIGFPLSELIRRVEPRGNAKYVEFITLADPVSMPGLKTRWLDWPYLEGLRMDEAMHPLTLLTFGAYGERLAPQNGAPIRVVIPWKYGFKGGKSIVRIRFVEKEPLTAWHSQPPAIWLLFM
jgi:Sulfite oxidase and related enzymes